MCSLHLCLAYGSALLVLNILLLLARVIYVVHQTHTRGYPMRNKNKDEKASLAVFLGSGGHTAEMMRLLIGMNWDRYTSRIYIVSHEDVMSESKVIELEKTIGNGDLTLKICINFRFHMVNIYETKKFRIIRIPRARRVHQSYLTSPFSTLHSFASCLASLTYEPYFSQSTSPGPGSSSSGMIADVILMNGPGSCVPIAIAAFLPRILGLPSPKLIYIESFARTRRLSLSGRLVRPLVDRFFVQWESLWNNLILNDKKVWIRTLKLKAEVEFDGWLV